MYKIKSPTNTAILLATYNGASYLKEQLDSIISQSNTNWTLYIHDDCSTDDTSRIISEYVKKDKRIILIDDNQRRGCAGSFLFLLEHIEAEYYMFCDQDDVWSPDKISKQLNLIKDLELKNPNEPIMVVHDLLPVNSNLIPLSNTETMWSLNITKQFNNPNHVKLYSLYPGCTMLFNNPTKNGMNRDGNPLHLLHDQLITITVSLNNGTIGYINSPLIKYRQHGDNTVGYQIIKNKWINRIKHCKLIFWRWNQQRNIANYYFGDSTIRYIYLYLKSKI